MLEMFNICITITSIGLNPGFQRANISLVPTVAAANSLILTKFFVFC